MTNSNHHLWQHTISGSSAVVGMHSGLNPIRNDEGFEARCDYPFEGEPDD